MTRILILVFGVMFALGGCNKAAKEDSSAAAAEKEAQAAPTNRVAIPSAVRTNLGITFAKVERRSVASTIRVPGRFELTPSARREHRAPLGGQVEIVAQQYQPVQPGDVLFRLDSPPWRQMQSQLADAMAGTEVAAAQLHSIDPIMEAHRLHEQGLREAVDLWTARVKQLEELGAVGGGRAAELADARANLNASRASFGEVLEKDAELQRDRAEAQSQWRRSQAQLELLLGTATSLTNMSRDQLLAPADETAASVPTWQRIAKIEVQATIEGVVEHQHLPGGTWAQEGELVLSVVNPSAVRFRAVGLQSDLGRLRDGLSALIIPAGAGAGVEASIPSTLQLGLDADAQLRTIELLATPSRIEHWSRAGVSAFLEIVTNQTDSQELAIPLSSVVHDGATPVIFRRDPANPDKAIRLEADLGLDDGRWIVINSGVKEGDEIVLDGVHQLMLATSGTAAKGGHFHSDGTFHAEDHD